MHPFHWFSLGAGTAFITIIIYHLLTPLPL